jgi:hypothetical protein
LLRSNSRAPTASSSARISALKAGCDRCSRAAARVKLRVSASATKARSWRVETSVSLIWKTDELIQTNEFSN